MPQKSIGYKGRSMGITTQELSPAEYEKIDNYLFDKWGIRTFYGEKGAINHEKQHERLHAEAS